MRSDPVSVTLHRLRREDGPRVLAWRNSEAVAQHMFTDAQIPEAAHLRWLDAALTQPDRSYWIIRLGDRPVGLSHLVRIDPAQRRCEWAYYLADPAVRGQGVGQSVAFAMATHVFESLGLNKVWCEVLSENTPSLHMLERVGFVREALFREHVVKRGQPRDVIGLGLLAREWPGARDILRTRFAERAQAPARLVD